MKTLLASSLLLTLLGCAPMKLLPTVKNCEYIKYERREIAIEFKAHCHLPSGDSDTLPSAPGF